MIFFLDLFLSFIKCSVLIMCTISKINLCVVIGVVLRSFLNLVENVNSDL